MRSALRHCLSREWQHLRGAYRRWSQDDGALMAAAVAYYVGLSFFPVLLVLIAGFGMFLRFTEQGKDAEAELLAMVATHLSAPMHDYVADALSTVQDHSTVTGPLGLIGILFASLAGFVHFERAFDRIWGVTSTTRRGIGGALRNVLIRRGVAFLLLLCSGLLIVIVFFTGLVLSGIQRHAGHLIDTPAAIWTSAQLGITVCLNALMFTLLYRWLSKVPVRWREAARGGVLAALLWDLGREVLATFLVKSGYGSAYGVIGSFIAILLWCYYAVAVVFFGAEYIQEFCDSRERS